jgi:D-alanyl-D-alanine carboxypeptidase/D-alanyl-D-alanine-endopeptidase (penicillin-binding protein 4)
MVYADKYEGDGILTTKLPDAPAYLANSFRTTLVKSGISVTGKVTPKMTDAILKPENWFLCTNLLL